MHGHIWGFFYVGNEVMDSSSVRKLLELGKLVALINLKVDLFVHI